MGSGGSKVKQIQSDHNVDIKFPERAGDERDGGEVNTIKKLVLCTCLTKTYAHINIISLQHTPEQNGDGIRASDIIRVSGRPENCEGARRALLEQVPITVEVDVPFKMHRHVIGQLSLYIMILVIIKVSMRIAN